MPTVSDVSDYFANAPDNLTLLRMLPCSTGALANNGLSNYNSERMAKHVVPNAINGAMFAGEEADGGGGRWPRQETLTLLEVRARLNTRFRQSTQKAPLWDEVSRYLICIFHSMINVKYHSLAYSMRALHTGLESFPKCKCFEFKI